jgi:hypothetical protein
MRTKVSLSREERIPAGYVEVMRDPKLGVLVVRSPDGLIVKAFSGRSQKAAFYTRFQTVERANAYITRWFAALVEQEARREQARAVRKAPHTLKAGDVLSGSWGYEQTNVDFYQVVETVGLRSVVLRKIESETIESGMSMQGQCVPMVGHFTGEPFRKLADGENRVKISSFLSVTPLEFNEVCGVRVYSPSRYSSYA